MSTDVQVSSKVEMSTDKQSKRRSKDPEKTHHRRSSNFQSKKHKYDHKFRKRSQSFNSSNGKFFPPYKMRKKDFIIPPTKFLLGGNITDPLNLNSLQDEEINRAMNAVTPKSSPLPTPQHRRGEIEVIIPPDITDPLNLTAGDDDATYEAMLTSPVKKTQKKTKKGKKRRNHRSSSGPGSGKEDSIEGAKLNQTDPMPCKEEKPVASDNLKKEATNEGENITPAKEQLQAPPPKRHKPDSHGNNSRAGLRKIELKDRKADLDKIVSPVIPQPGAWNDRHRFRPPPQRTPLKNNNQTLPTFKESDAKFQFGNYNRYYGYRNASQTMDVRLKVLERHKNLFRGKDVLDIGCNTGHLTLTIARDFGPNKVVGLDIDRHLIQVARTNIRHYVNCGKKDKFFPVSMPIVYGPIDVPGVSQDKSFPHNISFIQGNYVLESDVQLSMEQPQFDVILCLSITKWIQLNWGDAGLKRTFKRIYAQLRPGGVLVLEAQSWSSYKKKKKLTPEIWKNYHAIELFPHHFSQFLMSEIGFSRTEVIGSPIHHARGFQRPIKLFIKEDPSFDTPVYSANTSVCDSVTPRYCRDTPGHLLNFANPGSYSFRLPDNASFLDECSRDSNFAFGTPNSLTSSESGFSESLLPRRIEEKVYIPQSIRYDNSSEPDLAANSSQSQKESLVERNSPGETSALKYELLESEDTTLDSTTPDGPVEDNGSEVKEEITDLESTATAIKKEKCEQETFDDKVMFVDIDDKKNEDENKVNTSHSTSSEGIVEDNGTEVKKEMTNVKITKTKIQQEMNDKETLEDKVVDEDIIDKGKNNVIAVKENTINFVNPESNQNKEVQLTLGKNEVEMAIDSKPVENRLKESHSLVCHEHGDTIKGNDVAFTTDSKGPSPLEQSIEILQFPTEAVNSNKSE